MNKDTVLITFSPYSKIPYSEEIRIQNPFQNYNYFSIYSNKYVHLVNDFANSSQYVEFDDNGKQLVTQKQIIPTLENDFIYFSQKGVNFGFYNRLSILNEDIENLSNEPVSILITFYKNQPYHLLNYNNINMIVLNYFESEKQYFKLNQIIEGYNYVQIFSNIQKSFSIRGLLTSHFDINNNKTNEIICSNNYLLYYNCLNKIDYIEIDYLNVNQRKDIFFTFIFYKNKIF